MSRSKKKISIYTDGRAGTPKYFKRVANKVVRKSKEVPNGKAYKKLYCSWNIHDWKWMVFPEDDRYKEGLRK